MAHSMITHGKIEVLYVLTEISEAHTHTHTRMLTHGWIAVRYVGDGICTPLTRGFLCGRCVGMRRYLLLILNIVILLLVIHVGKCISTTTRRTNTHTFS